MKTVGIIGGLGPKTTAKFYLELISLCQKKSDTIARPSILILSVPIPYRVERKEILNGVVEEGTKSLLVDAAQKLEKIGADFLVMPCNSLHIFIENIRKSVNIPVLSIVEETVKFLRSKNVSTVGVLSTLVTKKKKLYETSLPASGIKCVLPSDQEQKRINAIILNLILGKYGDLERRGLTRIINCFSERGVKNIVLACTDLQLLAPDGSRVKIYDTMKILAAATAKEMFRN